MRRCVRQVRRSGAENGGSAANRKESLRPQESGTMAALVGNTRCRVNKQRMNGACQEAGIRGRSAFQAFHGGREEGGIIPAHCQSHVARGERTLQATGSLRSPGEGRDWNKPDWNLRLTYQGQELSRSQNDQGVDEIQTPFSGIPKPSFFCCLFFHETRGHQGQREM